MNIAMTLSSSLSFTTGTWPLRPPRIQMRTANIPPPLSYSASSKSESNSRNEGRSRRQVWRRRTLTKKDPTLAFRLERVPFLEEKIRTLKETRKVVTGDIERLLRSEENRYVLVNELAEEANRLFENNPEEYGLEKKAVFHAISNRMNDNGIYRPDAYVESGPFKLGPKYVRVR